MCRLFCRLRKRLLEPSVRSTGAVSRQGARAPSTRNMALGFQDCPGAVGGVVAVIGGSRRHGAGSTLLAEAF